MAEYRVFVLKITDSKTGQTKTLKSTLDPEQYKTIYLLQPTQTITYIDTWLCRGATRDHTPLCTSPKKITGDTIPDSQNVQNKS